MQRVSALLPAWDKPKAGNNANLDKVRGWADKIPSPVNRLSTGSHAYGPAPLEKECDKAARILKSFCGDGLLAIDDVPGSPRTSGSGSQKGTLKKIPPRIIQNAVGLAVFSSMRSGTWISNSGGSGILIARKADGTWSPPSGILVHAGGMGLVMSAEIYDCVLVINNFTVLETFTRPRTTLGTDVSLTEGLTMAVGWTEYENDVRWADLSDNAMTYLKAKGHFTDVKLQGTVIVERADENERFYWSKIGVQQILAGNVERDMSEIRALTEMLKAAEGRTDYDMALVEQLSAHLAPTDSPMSSPKSVRSTLATPTFGVPDTDDPDPFGVLALEMAGLEIREAGTKLRPASSQFEYNPSPASPLFTKFPRQSMETYVTKSNRGSYMSTKTERSRMSDAGTQTEVGETPDTTPSPSQSQSEDGKDRGSTETIPEVREPEEIEPVEVDYTKIDMSSIAHLSSPYPDPDTSTVPSTPDFDDSHLHTDHTDLDVKSTTTYSDTEQDEEEKAGAFVAEDESDADVEDEDEDDEEEEDDDEEEEPVIFEVATAQPPARVAMVASHGVQAKGAVVNIPKRVPPPLPVRSPRRSRLGQDFIDMPKVGSPLRQEFSEPDVNMDTEDQKTPRIEAAGAFPDEEIVTVDQPAAVETQHEIKGENEEDKTDEPEEEALPEVSNDRTDAPEIEQPAQKKAMSKVAQRVAAFEAR